MKQQLKTILNYISIRLSAVPCSIPAQEVSTCLAYLIARLTIFKYNSLQPEEVNKLLGHRFPDLHKIYLKTCKKLPATLQEIFTSKFDELIQRTEEPEKLIAWVYQFLKRGEEKAAFAKIGKENIKIEGRELLLTTQFFTDDYMVHFLVKESLKGINTKNLQDIVIIDCASGGGNFLLYSYDILFSHYQSLMTDWSIQQITDTILNNALIGYDLDDHLSRIASLALYVKACKRAIPNRDTCIYIFGGLQGDKLGFLAPQVSSNKIDGITFSNLIKKLETRQKTKIWLTNPPFMGKRDMDRGLKNDLLTLYPESKADLCVTFIQRIISCMGINDVAGLVTQNNWMYLSSLRGFRQLFLSRNHLRTCIDLGANAFDDINGEKTNVALLVIGTPEQPLTQFVELRQCSLTEKHQLLEAREYPAELTFELDQKQFIKNLNFEFHYQLEHRFENIRHLELYGSFGKPMQGTSTGDNVNFVKFAWEVNGSTDWKLVSKGGGYSKWTGLNYYKVNWGENAEKIKANKGSALRNISKMTTTQLVYSDTGTLGLNVRILKPGQVFIASGPGIQVNKGDAYAHMAFLNSRVATFLLKKINPKFTISAGYIAKIPVADGLLDSLTLSKKSQRCLKLKEAYLANKLPNFEFQHIDYQSITDLDSFIENQLHADLESDYQRLRLEFEIEVEIFKKFNFNPVELAEIQKVVGLHAFTKQKNNLTLNVQQLDKLIATNLDINCQSTSRSINGYVFGSESIFEDLAHKLDVHPSSLWLLASKNLELLEQSKAKYLDDLLHKIILCELGVKKISIYKFEAVNLGVLINKLRDNYSFLSNLAGLTEKTSYLLIKHHKLSFFNKPLVTLENQQLTVGQEYHE